MKDETKELLEEVTVKRLSESLANSGEEEDESFEEAMKSVDKLIELEKLEAEKDARLSEDEFRKKEASNNRKIQIATFVVGLVVAPVIDLAAKKSLAKFIGTVEQMEYFTSSAGKSISSWFRFGKK